MERDTILMATTIRRAGFSCAALMATMFMGGVGSAEAQTACQLAEENSYPTVCGYLWNDIDKDGIRDAGEPGLAAVEVDYYDAVTMDTIQIFTDANGYYFGNVGDGTYEVSVKIAVGDEATTPNVGTDETVDSDGVPDGLGASVVDTVTVVAGESRQTDFGFFPKAPEATPPPGTGTPGYWKNHPDAWPQDSITVGGVVYSKDDAISWMKKVSKDKTTTIFASLVSAMLNVMVGNDDSCIASTIAAADKWMASHPVGSNVAASSGDWAFAEPLHKQMDLYNNGGLCAPHRN